MKKVLVLHYSQTGQLSDVLKNLTAPLSESSEIEVKAVSLKPKKPFPFPWPLFRFFDTFPETVYLDAPEMEPLDLDPGEKFDLVILGYQAWFLSPSLPVTGFLKSADAARLLNGTPVVTVVACRDMWLMAQEQVKKMLKSLGAHLVGHVALVDEAGSVGSFLATPVWMMTGSRGPHLFGLIPRAGVATAQIDASRRFGDRIARTLRENCHLDEGLLKNLGAVRINEGLIPTEKAARRGFLVWGRLLKGLGPQGSFFRKPVLVLYMLWLVLIIITLVPSGLLLKKLLAPLTKKRSEALKAYFGQPSGS